MRKRGWQQEGSFDECVPESERDVGVLILLSP